MVYYPLTVLIASFRQLLGNARQLVNITLRCTNFSAPPSAEGHDLPIRQRRAHVSSTRDSCRSYCTARNLRVVPLPHQMRPRTCQRWRHSDAKRPSHAPRRGLPHDPMPTASLISATSPSAIWIETSEAQRDELHRWRIFFRLIGGSVPKSDRGTLPRSRNSSSPSSGVKWASKAKRLSRLWESSLCTPSARSDTSSYLSLFCRSCGPGPGPRGPAQP